VGFAVAREAGILDRVFPEASELEADDVLDRLASGPRASMGYEGRAWALMLTGWLAQAEADAATATLDRLWMHTFKGYPVRDRVLAALGAYRDPIDTDAALRHLSTRAELRLVLPIRAAVLGDEVDAAHARADELGILEEKPPPLIGGKDLKQLGVPPGPRMGEILRAVYIRQLDGEVSDPEQALDVARSLLALD
jgi:hypothetical protein